MRGAMLFIAALSLFFWCTAWAAGTLEIAPTTLNLSPGAAGLLYIKNSSAEPITMQVQPMDWKQSGNADVLSESNVLIASPPFLRILPGQRQIVRVFAAPTDTKHETDYRLLVSELPKSSHVASVVNVLLQFNIPVFAVGEPAMPAGAWSAAARNGGLQLVLRNSGPSTLKLGEVSVSRASGSHSSISRGLIYILPGAQHDWSLPDDSAASVRVSARDERSGVSLDADIPVQR
jgi:fimbrial chaperone protein